MNVTVTWKSAHAKACAESVLTGLRRSGHSAVLKEVAVVGQPVDTTHVACWGWRAGAIYRARGHEVLVMERGYLGDRFEWFSLGWNGLNGRAEFRGVRQDGGARFHAHHGHLVKPWRARGDYILLVGQVPGDASLRGLDLTAWYRTTALRARAFDLPVLFREHPEARKRGFNRNPGYTEPSTHATLAEALAGAALCITYNSNTGVDAILAGVPVMVADQGSMVDGLATHRPDDAPIYPDRAPLLYDLAWKQWRLEEIARGLPFHE